MKRISWTVFAGALAIVVAGAVGKSAGNPTHDDDGHRRGCSEATLRGTWGIQLQGTRPVPPPPAGAGGTESVIGVLIRHYDGLGSFTQVDNVKGSVTGTVPDRPGIGTYQVNDDCTGVVYLQPGPNINIVERFVIVDGGFELRSATMEPPPVMVTAVHRRISDR